MTEVAIDARMIFSSGVGRYLQEIIPRLARMRKDWTFKLLGDTSRFDQLSWVSLPNIEGCDYNAPIYSIREQLSWPASEVRDADLYWCPNYNVPLRWKGPLLVTVNDLAHVALPEIFSGFLKTTYAKTMMKQVQKRAGSIVFISEFSQNEFARLVGTSKANEFVILCGVSEEWFSLTSSPSAAVPYIIFVGNVKPHKNLKRLLEAFVLIQDKVPHELKIVGKKEGFITGEENIARLVQKFDGRVNFTGFIEDDVLKQAVKDADALTLASLYEGFGLPPVEAMACACPALVSNVASMPEVCAEGAHYCDPYDVQDIANKLLDVLTDQKLREQLKTNGLDRARELNWDSAAEKYVVAFEELYNRKLG